MTAWLLFISSQTTTGAGIKPPWQNPKYSTMQNITNVIGDSNAKYFLHKATFTEDVLLKTEVSCLIMKMSFYYDFETYVFRKYRPPGSQQTSLTSMQFSMFHNSDEGYNVRNYASIEDEEFEYVEKMHLVYSDYGRCALFYHDKTGDFEIWLYDIPDGMPSGCELLHALLSDKPLKVYYVKGCPTY